MILRVLLWAVLALLIAPLVMAAVDVCTEATGCAAFVTAWGNRSLRDGLVNSLAVAIPAASIATCFGFCLEFAALLRSAGPSLRPGRERGLMAVAYGPILLPEIILAVLYSSAYRSYGVPSGILPLVIAYLVTGVPIAQLLLREIRDEGLVDMVRTARDLGASPTATLWKVVLPLSQGSLFTVGALLLLLYINEFVIAFFLLGPGESTLSVVVFSSLRFGMRPESRAMIIAIALLSMVLGGCLGKGLLGTRARME